MKFKHFLRENVYKTSFAKNSITYDNCLCYILEFPQRVQGFVQCRLVHRQKKRDWYKFCNVCELLHHKLHCTSPNETIQCNHLV